MAKIKKSIEDALLDKAWQDYLEQPDNDYNNLPVADKKIIDEIDALLKKLSEDGREYWETYYG